MQDSEAAVNKLWKLLQASRRYKKLLSVHLQELLVVFVYMHVLVYSFAGWSGFFKGWIYPAVW